MTTTTKPNPANRAAWFGTRLGRAAAAVSLSTLAVVTLASGAFAQLADTIDLIGFSADSNDASGVPTTDNVDLAIGEGTCSVAILDPLANIVTFTPSASIIDIGSIVDGSNGPTMAHVGDICIKSEGNVPTDVYSQVTGATSSEVGPCTPGGIEETAEIALSLSCADGDAGELENVVAIELLCNWGTTHLPLHAEGPGFNHYVAQLQPGDMIDCAVQVVADPWTNPMEDFERALTDRLWFDLAITGEAPV